MTRPLPFTQHSLRRAIAGARKAGLRIKDIKPDGTLIVGEGENFPDDVADLAPTTQPATSSKWEDAEV